MRETVRADMPFVDTIVIVGAVVGSALVCAVLAARVRKHRVLRKRYGSAARSIHRRRRLRWQWYLPVLLLLTSAGCLALGFTGFRFHQTTTQGTVILAMDVSDSMDQTDVAPDRLTASIAAARAFLANLPSQFRVGLVTFAGTARLAVPPTDDRGRVAGALDDSQTSKGTVIGDGLSSALDAIQAQEAAGPSAVLLLSDGQDTGSEVSPEQSAERARALGTKVFTVAIRQTPDESGAMRQMATISGGRALTAQTAGQLTQIYGDLGTSLSYDLVPSNKTTPFIILGTILAIAAAFSVLKATGEIAF
jgi:Ca-activated chloride channel family protein